MNRDRRCRQRDRWMCRAASDQVPALFSMGVMPVPYTTWPVEEYVARQVRSFTPQGTAMVLLAIAQLQRGGLELFTPLFRRFHLVVRFSRVVRFSG